MEDWGGLKAQRGQRGVGYELTKLVHGEEEAEKAQSAARAVFSGGDSEHMPTYEVKEEEFKDGAVDIVTPAGILGTLLIQRRCKGGTWSRAE